MCLKFEQTLHVENTGRKRFGHICAPPQASHVMEQQQPTTTPTSDTNVQHDVRMRNTQRASTTCQQNIGMSKSTGKREQHPGNGNMIAGPKITSAKVERTNYATSRANGEHPNTNETPKHECNTRTRHHAPSESKSQRRNWKKHTRRMRAN